MILDYVGVRYELFNINGMLSHYGFNPQTGRYQHYVQVTQQLNFRHIFRGQHFIKSKYQNKYDENLYNTA